MEFEPSAQPGCVEEISVPADPVPLVDSSPKAACLVFDVLVRDPLRETVEAQSGARATVLYDAAGQPNHMYVLPRLTYADLGLECELGRGNVSAFEVGGVVKSELFIGVYQVSERHGLGCSLSAARPWVDLSYDEASAASAAKGPGWHMMTAHEWAAVAFWCMANGYQPRGNVANGCAGGRFRNEAGLGWATVTSSTSAEPAPGRIAGATMVSPAASPIWSATLLSGTAWSSWSTVRCSPLQTTISMPTRPAGCRRDAIWTVPAGA